MRDAQVIDVLVRVHPDFGDAIEISVNVVRGRCSVRCCDEATISETRAVLCAITTRLAMVRPGLLVLNLTGLRSRNTCATRLHGRTSMRP
jgi:hypothetical protein